MNHGPDEKGPEGLDSDELALRRMLHSAVQDIEPGDGTLDHLRRAVPVRRARKRQATVGMAAAALFLGTAIPALVHVSSSGGSNPNTSIAGDASQAQGGAGQGKNPTGGASTAGGTGGQASEHGQDGKKDSGKGKTGGTGTGATGGTGPSASTTGGTPVCTAEQLGSPTATAAAPDSAGIVYGSFRVTNISTTSCTVGGAGSVGVLAQGAADPTKIGTARHVAGDAATGLPDPSLEVTGLVLLPGSAYEEKFAFVPSAACPTPGGSTDGSATGGPSPGPSPSGDASAAGGGTSAAGSTSSGVTTQLVTEEGPADGSIEVSHTPEAGSPTAATTVAGACAGTVYWTGPLAAS
ncbi:hypothetical protein [Streptomyces brasiliensis]|uniref:DUF4232 domain-containing protein n=1 Tax=Streptomyces brasiliensis TaxID=1954 RepID=A0A917L750_9ACTN|nr:hypothetical protein [Streptomyces brasiliensis]GGJ49488.1 hypothetical protein GCM10010121_070820 [Streptomyces brasiliensis]